MLARAEPAVVTEASLRDVGAEARSAHLASRPTVLPQLVAALLVSLAVSTQIAADRLRGTVPASTLGPVLWVPSASLRAYCLPLAVMVLGAAAVVTVMSRRRWRWGLGMTVAAAGLVVLSRTPVVYAPLNVVGWTLRASETPALRDAVHGVPSIFAATALTTLTVALLLTRKPAFRPLSRAHGSAVWSAGDSLTTPTGLLLGRQGRRVLRYRGDGHLLTLAPTRSGKGVSVAVPNLLTYPGSVVVTDPKGELYAVTARRRRELGTEVIALDPFGVALAHAATVSPANGSASTASTPRPPHSASYNPLDDLDANDPDVLDDARLLADMLVVVEGPEHGEQAFWNEEARALLAGLILYIVAQEPPERRTLAHMRTLLTLPPELFEQLLARMSESHRVNGLVARSAARLLQKAEKERSGVISAAQSHTHFLDSAHMDRVLATSTLDLTDLKRRRVSLYLILPPDRIDTYQRWLRVMIAAALRAVTRTPGMPADRVLFLLDEFGHLGRMRPVERNISLVAGYGARLWLLVQSLSQLKATYGPAWPTFVANADVLQAFGVRDWETAEYLSKMTGDATVTTDSENRTRGVSRGKYGSHQEGTGETRAERARRLLLPDEVRRLPAPAQLLFVANENPVCCLKLDYRYDPALAAHADPNPLFAQIASAS